jgi:hypothetical protein
VGGQHHGPAALPLGKTRYPLCSRLGGPQGRSGRVRKISPPPGFDPWTIQPIANHYNDWATLAPNCGIKNLICAWCCPPALFFPLLPHLCYGLGFTSVKQSCFRSDVMRSYFMSGVIQFPIRCLNLCMYFIIAGVGNLSEVLQSHSACQPRPTIFYIRQPLKHSNLILY